MHALPTDLAVQAEQLARGFVEAMRAEIEHSFWAEAERVPLGGATKVGAEGYAFSNGCIVLVYQANVEEDFWRGQEAEWEALRERIGERDYAHLAVFYPGASTSTDALRAMAREDCKRALGRSLWEPSIAIALKETRDVRDRLKELFTSNPWLEKTLSAASGRLAAAEDRMSALREARAEAERGLPYEDYEDAVERAERFAAQEGVQRLERINAHTGELFAREFVKTYRKTVEGNSPAPQEQPPFYRAYPYRIAAVLLPNKCLLLTFRHSADAPGFESADVGYAEAAELLDKPDGAFVLGLDNDARLASAEAKYLAERVAERTAVDAKAAAQAKELASVLQEVEKDITGSGKTNPWLGPQAAKMAESLTRGRKALEKVHADSEDRLEGGAVLHNEIVRGDPTLAPHGHGEGPVAPPAAADEAATAQRVDTDVVAEGSGSGTTRAAEPQVSNVPESPAHVFQEVSYYDFPQSETVRELEASTELGAAATELLSDEPALAEADDLRPKYAELESRVGELERRLFYIERYTEMIQEKHLEQTKKLRDLIQIEGKRNRSRSLGVALGALLIGVLALIPVWPQTLDAIRAFFASIGLG